MLRYATKFRGKTYRLIDWPIVLFYWIMALTIVSMLIALNVAIWSKLLAHV